MDTSSNTPTNQPISTSWMPTLPSKPEWVNLDNVNRNIRVIGGASLAATSAAAWQFGPIEVFCFIALNALTAIGTALLATVTNKENREKLSNVKTVYNIGTNIKKLPAFLPHLYALGQNYSALQKMEDSSIKERAKQTLLHHARLLSNKVSKEIDSNAGKLFQDAFEALLNSDKPSSPITTVSNAVNTGLSLFQYSQALVACSTAKTTEENAKAQADMAKTSLSLHDSLNKTLGANTAKKVTDKLPGTDGTLATIISGGNSAYKAIKSACTTLQGYGETASALSTIPELAYKILNLKNVPEDNAEALQKAKNEINEMVATLEDTLISILGKEKTKLYLNGLKEALNNPDVLTMGNIMSRAATLVTNKTGTMFANSLVSKEAHDRFVNATKDAKALFYDLTGKVPNSNKEDRADRGIADGPAEMFTNMVKEIKGFVDKFNAGELTSDKSSHTVNEHLQSTEENCASDYTNEAEEAENYEAQCKKNLNESIELFIFKAIYNTLETSGAKVDAFEQVIAHVESHIDPDTKKVYGPLKGEYSTSVKLFIDKLKKSMGVIGKTPWYKLLYINSVIFPILAKLQRSLTKDATSAFYKRIQAELYNNASDGNGNPFAAIEHMTAICKKTIRAMTKAPELLDKYEEEGRILDGKKVKLEKDAIFVKRCGDDTERAAKCQEMAVNFIEENFSSPIKALKKLEAIEEDLWKKVNSPSGKNDPVAQAFLKPLYTIARVLVHVIRLLITPLIKLINLIIKEILKSIAKNTDYMQYIIDLTIDSLSGYNDGHKTFVLDSFYKLIFDQANTEIIKLIDPKRYKPELNPLPALSPEEQKKADELLENFLAVGTFFRHNRTGQDNRIGKGKGLKQTLDEFIRGNVPVNGDRAADESIKIVSLILYRILEKVTTKKHMNEYIAKALAELNGALKQGSDTNVPKSIQKQNEKDHTDRMHTFEGSLDTLGRRLMDLCIKLCEQPSYPPPKDFQVVYDALLKKIYESLTLDPEKHLKPCSILHHNYAPVKTVHTLLKRIETDIKKVNEQEFEKNLIEAVQHLSTEAEIEGISDLIKSFEELTALETDKMITPLKEKIEDFIKDIDCYIKDNEPQISKAFKDNIKTLKKTHSLLEQIETDSTTIHQQEYRENLIASIKTIGTETKVEGISEIIQSVKVLNAFKTDTVSLLKDQIETLKAKVEPILDEAFKYNLRVLQDFQKQIKSFKDEIKKVNTSDEHKLNVHTANLKDISETIDELSSLVKKRLNFYNAQILLPESDHQLMKSIRELEKECITIETKDIKDLKKRISIMAQVFNEKAEGPGSHNDLRNIKSIIKKVARLIIEKEHLENSLKIYDALDISLQTFKPSENDQTVRDGIEGVAFKRYTKPTQNFLNDEHILKFLHDIDELDRLKSYNSFMVDYHDKVIPVKETEDAPENDTKCLKYKVTQDLQEAYNLTMNGRQRNLEFFESKLEYIKGQYQKQRKNVAVKLDNVHGAINESLRELTGSGGGIEAYEYSLSKNKDVLESGADKHFNTIFETQMEAIEAAKAKIIKPPAYTKEFKAARLAAAAALKLGKPFVANMFKEEILGVTGFVASRLGVTQIVYNIADTIFTPGREAPKLA